MAQSSHPRGAWRRAVPAAGLVAYVAAVYLLVVVAGGRLATSAPAARPALTFVAAALVAVTLEPVRERLRRWRPLTPEQGLLRLTTGRTAQDPGARLAELTRLASEALGAAPVRITASLGPELSTSWQWPRPPESAFALESPSGHGSTRLRRTLDRGGRQLGELTVQLPAGRELRPVERSLLDDATDHAALLLSTASMDQTLRQVVAESAALQRELRASRSRIVTAMEEERRRVERDIHDGAQQHLVALVVNLRLLRVLLDRDPDRARTTARTLADAVQQAIETLDRLSHGLYPDALARGGPVPALQEVAAASPVPVVVQAAGRQRWPTPVERAAYFGCLEALQNAIKHAGARRIVLTLTELDGGLAFEVADDGRGFDPAGVEHGSGSVNLRDRISALGGRVRVLSRPGEGTTVSGWVPVEPSTTRIGG